MICFVVTAVNHPVVAAVDGDEMHSGVFNSCSFVIPLSSHIRFILTLAYEQGLLYHRFPT
jgi:hypothetical protein